MYVYLFIELRRRWRGGKTNDNKPDGPSIFEAACHPYSRITTEFKEEEFGVFNVLTK